MSLKGEIAKANVIFTFGRIIAVGVSFFFSIILARFLQPYNFGLYSFCLMIAGLFTMFADFGLNSTTTRFVANYIGKNKHKDVSSLFKWILKYKLILTIAAGILISLFSDQIAIFVFNKPEAGFVVFFSGFVLIFMSLFEFFKALFFGLKNFGVSSLMQILENVIKFAVVIGFVLLGMSISGILLGVIISYIVLTAICVFIIYKKYSFIVSGEGSGFDKKVLLGFTTWVFIGSLTGTIYGFLDQFIVSVLLTVEDIGFYKIAQSWMWSVIFLVPIASQVLYPYFSGSEDKKHLNLMCFSSIKYSAIFVFPLAFLMSAFSTPLILFFYKSSYLAAVEPLIILAITSIFVVLSMVLTSYFIGINKPDITTKVVSVLVWFYIALAYLMTSVYGIIGTAFALLFVKAIETVILFIVAIKKYEVAFKVSIILKPLIASVVMYFAALVFLPNVTNYFTFVLYGILSLLFYLAVMLLIKGIKKEDFLLLKGGLRFLNRSSG
jgi:O-antigen/teichoic acid export membrane protein